jgi:hypothetical protein
MPMLLSARAWRAGRRQRRRRRFAEQHAWIDTSELDEAASTFEGGDDPLVRPAMPGPGGIITRRLTGRAKIPRGD